MLLINSLAIALLVKNITKYYQFPSDDYQFNNAKKSAMQSFLIIIAEILIGLVYLFVIKSINPITTQGGLSIYLLQILFYILLTVIVFLVVLYIEKERLQSLGISKKNLKKSIILGILLGVILFVMNQGTSKAMDITYIFTVASLLSFIEFVFVGFSEEIMFRGYLQTRLIVWLGTTKGFLITAIIFSYYHLPVNMIFKGMDVESAFISCTHLIPLSMMLGYIMIKTKNITTVAILHTAIDWIIN